MMVVTICCIVNYFTFNFMMFSYFSDHRESYEVAQQADYTYKHLLPISLPQYVREFIHYGRDEPLHSYKLQNITSQF